MSIDFSKLIEWRTPHGVVAQITDSNGSLVWEKNSIFNYVSLGDSIAAGHSTNADWETNYGVRSQYGENGNTLTVIVPNSYTNLIQNKLSEIYGIGKTNTTSFAHSGDTVSDLIGKLSHDNVVNAIEKADLVTICIGANDVLQPALHHFDEYVNTGDLSTIAAIVDANLATLEDDSANDSYKALFDRLTELNPNAQFVFTTIYNPYKYLWLDEGSDGFFKPLLDTIPQITVLGFEVDELIKDSLLNIDGIRMLYDRVNGLGAWAETYTSRLNNLLRDKINNYQSSNPNIKLAETKTLFEVFPDRSIIAEKHYNDLVNVEFTRGFDVSQVDWGQLYIDTDAGTFWLDLATRYVSLSGLNIGGLANELMQQIVEKVLMPDVDPHPEEYGHYVMMRSFIDIIGWQSLDRYSIIFDSNGGIGSMSPQTVVGVDNLPSFVNINALTFTPNTGYHFVNWATSVDGSGTAYSDMDYISTTNNMNLYAQWSNRYAIIYRHTNHTNLFGNDETGHMECYALWIYDAENPDLGMVEMPDLGKFSENNSPIYYYPYDSKIKVVVSNYNPTELTYDDCDCNVYKDGVNVASGYRGTSYEFYLRSNVVIDFQWKIAGSLVTFDARSWEDCYITSY